MKWDHIQTSFSHGELAPSLHGRVAIDQYSLCASTVRNFIVTPYGSLTSCPGTEFINDAKNLDPSDTSSEIGVDDDTLLLLHFDGNFVDSSPYAQTVNPSGGTFINSTTKVFGSGSGEFDGVNDKLIVDQNTPDYSEWFYNDFTVDFRVNFDVAPSTKEQFILGMGPHFTTDFIAFSLSSVGPYANIDCGNVVTDDIEILIPTFSTGTWYHLAWVRSSATITFFIDGISAGTGTIGQLNAWRGGSTDKLLIGTWHANDSNNLDGKLDEFRISKNARWTSNFTPPSVAYSNASNFKARLIDFVFSRTDAYIIEMGVGYFRFYTDGAVIEA